MDKLIILLLSILTIGCTSSKEQPYSSKLLGIEQTIKEGSNDLRAELSRMKLNEQNSSADSALHALLYMECCMEQEITFTDDSIADIAIQYYNNHDDNDRLARAYIAKAINNRKRMNYFTAIQNVMKAKSIASGDDLWTNFLIARELGIENYLSEHYDESIKNLKISLVYSSKLKQGRNLQNDNWMYLANCYDRINKTNSFMYCIKQIKGEKTDNGAAYGRVKAALGDYYLRKGNIDKAEKYLREAMEYDYTRKASYLLGNIAQEKGEIDQAIYFWKDAISSSDSQIADAAANAILKYDDSNVLVLNIQNKSYKSLIQNMSRSKDVINYQTQFEASQKQEKNLRNIIILLSIVIVLLIMLLIFYIYYRQKIKLFRHHISNINQQYMADIDAYNKARNDIQLLEKKIAEYQEDKSKPEEWNMQTDLLNSEAILHLHRLASRGSEATTEDWKEISELLSLQDADFIKELASHQEITQKEQNLCLLVRLRFIPSEISALLGISSQNVTNMRGRLLLKMYNKKGGAREFDTTIRSI